MIVCRICSKSFKLLTNTHLLSHGLSMAMYIEQFPDAETISTELAIRFSARSKLSNEGRKGVKRSQGDLENIKKGIEAAGARIAHNKGKPMAEPQKALLRNKALVRNENWRNSNNNPLTGHVCASETRSKISQSVSRYALNNPVQVKSRATLAVQTTHENGHYLRLRAATIDSRRQSLMAVGLVPISAPDDFHFWQVQCSVCNNVFRRNLDSAVHAKICTICFPRNTSDAENEIADFFRAQEIKVVQRTYDVLDGLELDIYLPEFDLAVEHNGLFWHSELQGKKKWYHRQKTKLAADKGVRLIQIFEDEWIYKKDIVMQRLLALLGKLPTIGARSCTLQQIDSGQADQF